MFPDRLLVWPTILTALVERKRLFAALANPRAGVPDVSFCMELKRERGGRTSAAQLATTMNELREARRDRLRRAPHRHRD